MRLRAQVVAPIFVVAALFTIAAVVLPTAILPGSGTKPSSDPGSANSKSVGGLVLAVQINPTTVTAGGSVVINVSETNTGETPLNVSAKSSWGVQGLRMGACYSSIYPFGIAIFQGRYTSANVSEGTHLNLYPIEPCPLLIRYISGYYFQPSSDVALVLPGTGPGIPMASGLIFSGNYTQGTDQNPLTSGTYTVVAGDEWGALAFVYFQVS